MNWRFWKKGSNTIRSIIPVKVQQETWADRVNSASKWYHKAVETLISFLAASFIFGYLFTPLVPVFFLVDRFIDLFVRRRKSYDIGPVEQCFAVIGCVFWPTFLWSAYDAGFLNLILETIWKNDRDIQINSILTLLGTIYFIEVFRYNLWPLNHKENFLLISFSISFVMFTIVRHRTQSDTFKYSDSIKEGLKWTSIASFLLAIYNFITIFTYIVVSFFTSIELSFLKCSIWLKHLKKFTVFWKSNFMYWVNGLKDSIDYILGSLLLLFAWERFCLPLFSQPERIRNFGFWTCVSLFIWSILWLIKTYVLLSWEAHSISKYNQRLGSKIVNGSKHLYFLLIFGEDQSGPKLSYREKIRFRHYLLNVEKNTFTMYRKQQLVKHLLEYKNIFGIRNAISMFIDQLKKAIRNIEVPSERDESKKLNIYLTRIISEDDLKCFNEQLEKDGFGDSKFQNITFQELQNWLEKARNNYLRIANTLSRQQEVVDCLDKIMTLVVLLASFVIWLHLTGTSTTNVILAIVSPFVIGNFMFREIWNAMITGIMFVYFMHPFDVGDLCIVDDEMMEVKSVGIWRTTFEKVDTQEEVIYSNSDLSNKRIINHTTYFDWNDYKELNVGSLEAEKVNNLKRKIENYLSDKSKFTKTSVEVLTSGDDIKIAAKFRHNPTNMKNNSYYECLNKKRQLRSEFVLHVQSFMDKHKDPPNVKTGDEFLHKEHVPAIVLKDLDKCIDVKGDGNCGFRCVSHAYNQGDDNKEQWSFIRKELLTEIRGHRETYKAIYGVLLQDNEIIESSNKDEIVDRALDRIDWDKPDQGAPQTKWMEKDDLYAVATRFNYAIVFYVKHEIKSSDKKEGLIGCSTILPLRAEVGVEKPEAELAIAFVGNNHYIRLIMKGDDYPLPPIESRWFQNRDESVDGWENFYSHRFHRWKKEITTSN